MSLNAYITCHQYITINILFLYFLKQGFFFKILFIFRERGREGEREGEKQQCVVALVRPLLGTWPATQGCALTGNRTGDPLVFRPALNPLSHTSQGYFSIFKLSLFLCVHQRQSLINFAAFKLRGSTVFFSVRISKLLINT